MSCDDDKGWSWRSPVFINGACGAIAGTATAFIVSPLDVMKTRLQLQTKSRQKYSGIIHGFSKLYREEGFRAAYQGLTPTVLALLPSWAIYFPVYEHMKSKLADYPIPAIWQHVLASSTAGIANVFATNPFWVAKTRLQIQGFHSIPTPDSVAAPTFKYRGAFHALYSIVRHEGLAGIYSGLSPSLVGVSHIAIQVPLYEELKRIAVSAHGDDRGKNDASIADIVFSSSLAKMVASTATYPHEVVRSHMHASGRGGFSAFIPICKEIMKEDGFRGLYRGLGANLLRTTPAAAITFLTYEASRKFITEWIDENGGNEVIK